MIWSCSSKRRSSSVSRAAASVLKRANLASVSSLLSDVLEPRLEALEMSLRASASTPRGSEESSPKTSSSAGPPVTSPSTLSTTMLKEPAHRISVDRERTGPRATRAAAILVDWTLGGSGGLHSLIKGHDTHGNGCLFVKEILKFVGGPFLSKQWLCRGLWGRSGVLLGDSLYLLLWVVF